MRSNVGPELVILGYPIRSILVISGVSGLLMSLKWYQISGILDPRIHQIEVISGPLQARITVYLGSGGIQEVIRMGSKEGSKLVHFRYILS